MPNCRSEIGDKNNFRFLSAFLDDGEHLNSIHGRSWMFPLGSVDSLVVFDRLFSDRIRDMRNSEPLLFEGGFFRDNATFLFRLHDIKSFMISISIHYSVNSCRFYEPMPVLQRTALFKSDFLSLATEVFACGCEKAQWSDVFISFSFSRSWISEINVLSVNKFDGESHISIPLKWFFSVLATFSGRFRH